MLTRKQTAEIVHLLEEWSRKNGLIAKGKKLVVTVSVQDNELVTLTVEDATPAAVLDEILARPITSLDLKMRPRNCLLNRGLTLVGDVARTSHQELFKTRNFGNRSLKELEDKLRDLGLSFDMVIPVGPLEREAVLQGPIEPYVYPLAFQALTRAGVRRVKELIELTKEDITRALQLLPEASKMPEDLHSWIQRSLRRRGIIS